MDDFEWIPITSVGNWKCPYCGNAFVFTNSNLPKYRYCPYCGHHIKEKA